MTPSCRRTGDPFQGPRVDFSLTLGNELSGETPVLTKQEPLLGRGTQMESSGVREPGELFCHVAHSLKFYGDEANFWVVSDQSS